MPSKSPRKEGAKKAPEKSLKEKRAEKKNKSSGSGDNVDIVSSRKK